jgi:hypothetical protein
MKAKLQVDIDADLIERVERHRQESGKAKARIVTEALWNYLEGLNQVSPAAPEAPQSSSAGLQEQTHPETPAKSLLDFFGAETAAEGGLKNFAPTPDDQRMTDLRQRLQEPTAGGVDESYAEQVRRSAEQVARRQARQTEENA